MTRNEDVFIPLGVRVAKARSRKADIFISIHADAFTTPQPRGTGVYALSRGRATSAAARWLAQSQNASDQIGGIRGSGHPQGGMKASTSPQSTRVPPGGEARPLSVTCKVRKP